MDKEKQKDQWQEIAEIRNIIYSTMCIPSSGFPKEIVDRYVRGYRFGIVASALYDSGYRKQSDTAKKIFQSLYDRTQNYHGDRIILTSNDIKELAEKYGVKLED